MELLPNRAWSNSVRDLLFAEAVAQKRRGEFDRLVGFGKLLDLDVLYCADPCLAARPPRWCARLTSRRRIQMRLEAASFSPGKSTQCLLLSPNQADEFRRVWSTEPHRLVVLPPTTNRARRHPEFRTDGVRERVRASLLDGRAAETLWLAFAGDPKRKGLDRSVAALAAFPAAKLAIAGIENNSQPARQIKRWARKAGVADRLRFLGLREDIPELMAAADLLIHPARFDTTGTVILEAVVNGLPVITTPQCGYAAHVAAADAGRVLPEAFSLTDLTEALRSAESAETHARWSLNGAAYGKSKSLFDGLDRAAEIIAGARSD